MEAYMRAKSPRDRMIPVNISFEPDLLEQVDAESERRGIGRSDLVRRALHFWFTPEAELIREEQPSLFSQG
jgi:metal-responsive CopG/Arc/MetJ family transcriptional regulator